MLASQVGMLRIDFESWTETVNAWFHSASKKSTRGLLLIWYHSCYCNLASMDSEV